MNGMNLSIYRKIKWILASIHRHRVCAMLIITEDADDDSRHADDIASANFGNVLNQMA